MCPKRVLMYKMECELFVIVKRIVVCNKSILSTIDKLRVRVFIVDAD